MTRQVRSAPPGDRPAVPAPPQPPPWRYWLWPVAVAIALVLWALLPTLHIAQVNLTYSQFLSDVAAHKVKTVTLAYSGQASGTLSDGSIYTTVIPRQAGPGLLDRLQAAKVQIAATLSGPSFASEVLSWLIVLLPLLLLGWLWLRLSRSAAGLLQGVLGIGRSRAKVFDAQRLKPKFSDVAGYEGAKAEIAEVVDFLRNPARYRGGHAAAGVLMVGRPAPGRRCWLGPWPAKRRCRSSPSRAPVSWRCSWERGPRACVTCSARRASGLR